MFVKLPGEAPQWLNIVLVANNRVPPKGLHGHTTTRTSLEHEVSEYGNYSECIVRAAYVCWLVVSVAVVEHLAEVRDAFL